MLVKMLFVILLISCVLPPNTEAASLAPTTSNSVSNSPSFSASTSISYSTSLSYSPSTAASISGTTSASASYSFSTSVSYSAFNTISATNTSVAPAQALAFQNRCPFQADTICPFWLPDIFPRYKLECMNTNGSMLTINNIDVSNLEIPQYPLSSDSTKGFITSGSTYRCSVYGCDITGTNCVQPWTPIVVVLPEKKRTSCDPNYACKIFCTVPAPGVVQCTWVNTAKRRIKRVILQAFTCYNLDSYQPLDLLTILGAKRVNKSPRRPKNQPNSISLSLPTNALCYVNLILRYRFKQISRKYGVFC